MQLQPRQLVLLAFIFFVILAILVSWKAIDNPFFYDDLHLIRAFTPEELRSAFVGNWDVDGIESRGYRPLTTLFNHLRYFFFGEDVIAHRVFQAALFAFYLTLLCWVAYKFGMSWGFGLVAASLILVARYNIPHLVWVTDGTRLLQAVLFILSLTCLITAIDRSQIGFYSLSVLLSVINLFVREDSIAAILVIILLGYLYAGRTVDKGKSTWKMHVYLAACLLAGSIYFGLRTVFVPQPEPLQPIFPQALLTIAELGYGLTGITSFDAFSRFFLISWPFILLFIIFVSYFKVSRVSLIWLFCTVISLTVLAISGYTRPNLLFFPLTFFCLFLGAQLEMIFFHLNGGKPMAALLLVWLFTGSLYFRFFALESLHPQSVTWNQANASFVYGEFAAAATIPVQRYEDIRARLESVGVNSWEDAQDLETVANGRHRPNDRGEIFLPYIHIFTP
ncbi:MAG: hypothetical protein M1347_05850 [Chloroflexi bacterium]|nr:hypothetical protein [Chloroflexota bacterium]